MSMKIYIYALHFCVTVLIFWTSGSVSVLSHRCLVAWYWHSAKSHLIKTPNVPMEHPSPGCRSAIQVCPGSDFTCPGCQISNQISFIVRCRFEFLIHSKVSRRCSVLRAQSSNVQDLHDNHLRTMCREVGRAIQKVANMQNDLFRHTNLSDTCDKHVHTTEFVRWSLTCQVTELRKYKSSWGAGYGTFGHTKSFTQTNIGRVPPLT